MARIDWPNIQRIEKERNNVHASVNATYTTFEHSGRRFIQIDTYGRSDRENPHKISQSFQLDKHDAEHLIDLLQDTFDMAPGERRKDVN